MVFGLAHVAQLAEHVLGKDEVISSILIMGSNLRKLSVTIETIEHNQHQETE
jgi:hypothetical protein